MNVLMTSLDPALLDDTNRLGDVRQRHIAYAQELERLRPGSTLHIIVRARQTEDNSSVSMAPNLWGYAVGANVLSFVIRTFERAKSIARRFPPDLITTQSPFLDGLVGCVLRWRLGTPLLVQLHISRPGDSAWLREKPGNRLRSLVARWVMHQADGVRVNTEGTGQWLTKTWEIPPEKIYVNPVSPVHLTPDSSIEKSNRPTVLYVGRLAPEKGVDVLLKAFSKVVAVLPEAHLLIVGDGAERNALQSLASALKLSKDTVTFAGAVAPSSLAPYYQRAWVVALPSRHESFGRVILEAFTFGRPVVATDTDGARTLVRDKVDGFIVPREDLTSLSRQLLFLLQSPEVVEEMGTHGKEAAERHGDARRLHRELVNIWLAVAER